jgi:flagellin-like hook-associated protein FlgL
MLISVSPVSALAQQTSELSEALNTSMKKLSTGLRINAENSSGQGVSYDMSMRLSGQLGTRGVVVHISSESQSNFASAIANQQAGSAEMAAARSRMMSDDAARATANSAGARIQQQGGAGMSAQANVLPEQVLALLR